MDSTSSKRDDASRGEVVFRPFDHAQSLVSRNVGRQVHGALLETMKQVDPGDRIVIDLGDADVLTPSFVDEFFGRLVSRIGMDEFRRRFRIVARNHDVRNLIGVVVRNRVAMDARSAGEASSPVRRPD